MKIGILGGSFDPIHEGHLTLARESQKQFGLEKVLFVPASCPPHKKSSSELSPPEDRAQMTRLAIQGKAEWECSDLELKRGGVSYTVDTLRELKKHYPPPHQLFFIIGADSFQDLPHWKEPEEILKLSEWIVAPRPSVKLPRPLPSRFHLLRIPPMEIAASDLRRWLEQGKDVSSWIPQGVRDYLKQKRIYEKSI